MSDDNSTICCKRGPKCRGILGVLFGHKFTKVVMLEIVKTSNYCWRCGYCPENG